MKSPNTPNTTVSEVPNVPYLYWLDKKVQTVNLLCTIFLGTPFTYTNTEVNLLVQQPRWGSQTETLFIK